MSTIKLAIGVPRQEIDLLIDINSYMPFLYNEYCILGGSNGGTCEYANNLAMTYNFEDRITFWTAVWESLSSATTCAAARRAIDHAQRISKGLHEASELIDDNGDADAPDDAYEAC